MVRSSIRILLFAPELPGEAIATQLRNGDDQFVVSIEHDETAVLERLQDPHDIDCLLGTDNTLLACSGDGVRPVVAATDQIPTVLLTASASHDEAEAALEAGVTEYLRWTMRQTLQTIFLAFTSISSRVGFWGRSLSTETRANPHSLRTSCRHTRHDQPAGTRYQTWRTRTVGRTSARTR